ncbi:MAG TPA: tetratricopeptide repeat protein [Micropepsaceae bacterium]|nr:tetratricopeptide repeat protein [Micropepsaceae bacterium]
MAAHRAGDFVQAERHYRAALQANANDIAALTWLGVLKAQQSAHDEAQALLDRSLALEPRNVIALNALGNIARTEHRHEDALTFYGRVLALDRANVPALFNRGVVLSDLGGWADALTSYDAALALMPTYGEAHSEKGRALAELGRPEEALLSFAAALKLKPDLVEAYQNRINVLKDLGRLDDALADYERVIALGRDRPYVTGDYLALKMDMCLWEGWEELCRSVVEGVASGARVTAPFELIKIASTPELQKHCAEIYVRDSFLSSRPLASKAYRHDKIRLAYVSNEFKEHATAYLAAELFERHDRGEFETYAISFGVPKGDAMEARLREAFDHFVPAANQTSEAIARMIAGHEIDIAVDLKGFTRDSRPEIFAMKPAPILASYLGWPGTTGAPYMDYLIADATLIPREHRDGYTEKLVLLPDSYQPNDAKRAIAETPPRGELGLPEQAFVFASFNAAFKLTPDLFDVWARLLKAVDGSVLWLLDSNESAKRNLLREARARNVAERLVFAPKLPLAQHLARHRAADLFLDSFHCNAHTTASDALWAGLPLLTRLGPTFASRVAASLLKAVRLPELIAESADDYEAKAIRLAREPALLHALKERLKTNRATCPLFDAKKLAKNLERAYHEMHRRHVSGEAPDHIDLTSCDEPVN